MVARLPFRVLRPAAFAVVASGPAVAAHLFAGLGVAFAAVFPLPGRERA
ncbi:hypothetical protein [Herbidospora galbida]|nr:hypothetical protein [Herbidospora galbida]